MDFGDGFESFLRFVLITAIVFIVGVPLRRYLIQRGLKKYPQLQKLQKVKTLIRSLKQQGRSYNEIITEIKTNYKLPKYMIQGMIIDVENEQKTQIENPKRATKSDLEFTYPKNWKIKALDAKLNAEQYFTVEGSYSGIVSFSVFKNGISDIPSLEEINDILSLQYKRYQVKDGITKYGRFMGTGNNFVASVLNNSLTGKVFRYTDKNGGFYLTMAAMDDDYANVSDGFKMIEESLKTVE